MDAFAAKTCATQHMGRQFSVGIKPHLARAKQKAGVTDIVNGLHLFGAEFLLDPDEFAFAGEITDQPPFVEIGEDLRQFGSRAVGFDHQRRLGVKGMGGKVRGQDAPVAIHDIGPLGDDRGTRGLGAGL